VANVMQMAVGFSLMQAHVFAVKASKQ